MFRGSKSCSTSLLAYLGFTIVHWVINGSPRIVLRLLEALPKACSRFPSKISILANAFGTNDFQHGIKALLTGRSQTILTRVTAQINPQMNHLKRRSLKENFNFHKHNDAYAKWQLKPLDFLKTIWMPITILYFFI